MAQKYPWYAVVDGKEKLRQGDFFKGLPLTIPPADFEYDPDNLQEIPVIMDIFDVIVLTQSCDLENEKIEMVQVCPYWTFEEVAEKKDFFKTKEGKESLIRSMSPGFHLLAPCDIAEFESGHLVVIFKQVFGVNYDFLVDFAKKSEKRLRLLPPYRERLSQDFAKYFMRVGLPEDMPPFTK